MEGTETRLRTQRGEIEIDLVPLLADTNDDDPENGCLNGLARHSRGHQRATGKIRPSQQSEKDVRNLHAITRNDSSQQQQSTGRSVHI
jgi:hypothetical protein